MFAAPGMDLDAGDAFSDGKLTRAVRGDRVVPVERGEFLGHKGA